MNPDTHAETFRSFHTSRSPLILLNVWDAGGARLAEEAGAKAVGTSSWAIAAAHGYEDGEQVPFEFLLALVERIAASVEIPVTVDFESGYAEDLAALRENARRLLLAGAVGVNLEDRLPSGELRTVREQVDRIRAVKEASFSVGLPLFLNARTDVFFRGDDAPSDSLRAAALERARAYRDAGADGLFVPGLLDLSDVSELTARCPMPVNIMLPDVRSDLAVYEGAGVSRFSFGPAAYLAAAGFLGSLYSGLEEEAG